MDAGMVGMPGGPFGGADAFGAIRWMLAQFQAVALATGAPGFNDQRFDSMIRGSMMRLAER
jgi:hypothetical protein